MATYESWTSQNATLKRKGLVGAVLIAAPGAVAPAALTGADGALVARPTGYNDLGYTTEDGAQIGRSTSVSDVTAWQARQPLRSDVTSDSETIKVAFHETNAHVLALYFGVDLAALVPDPTSGEVAWSKPALPSPRYNRLFVLARDNGDGGAIYFGESYPRVGVTDWDDLQYANTDDGIVYGLTMTTYPDETLGYSRRSFRGGPGWAALNTTARFPASV